MLYPLSHERWKAGSTLLDPAGRVQLSLRSGQQSCAVSLTGQLVDARLPKQLRGPKRSRMELFDEEHSSKEDVWQ